MDSPLRAELGPALGMIELHSIARGIVVCDAMVKRAPVRVLQNHPVSPGKHVVIAYGGVAEIEEAMTAGLETAGATLADSVLLPQVHDSLPPLIAGTPTRRPALDSVAVFETNTLCASIVAADAAAKAADVTLLDLRLGNGIGGKAFFTMTGGLEEIQASVLAGQSAISPERVVAVEIIAAPHGDFGTTLIW